MNANDEYTIKILCNHHDAEMIGTPIYWSIIQNGSNVMDGWSASSEEAFAEANAFIKSIA